MRKWETLPGLATDAYYAYHRGRNGAVPWVSFVADMQSSLAWLTSERWPTLICDWCGRSDAAHYAGVADCPGLMPGAEADDPECPF